LHDPQSIYNFPNSEIIIPLIVLEELDRTKIKFDNVGVNARNFIKTMDGLRNKGSLFGGVELVENCIVKVKDIKKDFSFGNNSSLSLESNDNRILALAVVEQFNNPEKEVTLVTRDLNLRVKGDSVGVKSEGYDKDKTVTSRDELYDGFAEIEVEDELIDRFYAGEKVFLDNNNLYCNQFVNLLGRNNNKKSGLARFVGEGKELAKVGEFKKGCFGLYPKSKEQIAVLNLLMDPSIAVVSLSGQAGTGKTLCALAAGLQQVIGSKQKYKKIIVSRPNTSIGPGLGWVPGTKEDKILVGMGSIIDNLDFMLGDSRALENYVDQNIIELENLSYIRGRSINEAYIIFDECQSYTPNEMKAILTRVGEGSKIILTGDLEQIDTPNLNELTSGFSYTIEKLKGQKFFSHVTLKKSERSEVAGVCARLL